MSLWKRTSNWIDKIDRTADQLRDFRDDLGDIVQPNDRGVRQPRPPGIPGLPDNLAVNPRVILGAKIAAAAIGVLAILLVLRK